MTRPRIAAAVAAELVTGLPSRLVAKLDADPKLAERWAWAGAAITTDKGEVVTLVLDADGVVTAVACSCLLQPRCLHVGAVVSLLEPADRPTSSPATTTSSPTTTTSTSTSTPAEAETAFAVIADVLATGAQATGSVAQAELLRSIHACRAAGLHRLASAQTRILSLVRELRADRPEFALAVLAAELREALVVAHALAAGDANRALVGRARRDYDSIGQLHVRGLFSEAIVARSGYAGCVTYLLDDRGALYTRADVAAGDAGRAAGAYDAPAGLGDAILPHRELARAGLFISDATASADGRLGAGQRVRAVRASDASRWDHPTAAARWQVPLATQLATIAAHDAAPDELRPAGWDLVFADGVLAPRAGRVALVLASGGALELATAHDQRALCSRDNLDVLARAPGLHVLAIGRVRISAPGRLELLAIGPAPDDPRLVLPEAWHGRANVDYDCISVPASIGAAPVVARAPVVVPDLLSGLRRRVERVAHGGLATLPTHALAELDREARALAARALGGGGDALRALGAVAHESTRALTGARRPIDRPRFARAWLRAALYEDAARRRLALASW